MISIDISEGVAVLTIDRPGRSMNVMDWDFAVAFDAAMTRVAGDPAVSGVILTSAKETFVVGADLSIMADFVAPGVTVTEAARMIRRLGDPLRRMERCGKPVVAAAPGTALGGGLEIMLACHYRIAARGGPENIFGLPEVTLGLLPSVGGTQRLPRLVGIAPALSVLAGGKPMDVSAARASGIIDEIVAPEDLVPAARRALAEGRVAPDQPWDRKGFSPPGARIGDIETFKDFILANAAAAADPGPFHPAPGAILSCVYEGLRLPMDKALKIESQYFAHLATGPRAQALIASTFFLRQRMAKRGVRRGQHQDPVAVAVRGAMVAEAERIAAGGISANVINNASLRAGLPAMLPPAPGGSGSPTPGSELDRIVRRLLVAGALVAATMSPDDPDAGDLAALDGASYPAWTGGPFHLIDAIGTEKFGDEARRLGVDVPITLTERPRFRGAAAAR